jgi:hypothetical protein
MNLRSESRKLWAARIAVMLVLMANLSAAIPYVLNPDGFASAFELSGVSGAAMVRGIGILFLMWCVAYVPTIVRPDRHPALLGVILVQQVIGLAGEGWIIASLPPGYNTLSATGLRFMIFDSVGLALLIFAFMLVRRRAAQIPQSCSSVRNATPGR